MFMTSHTFLDKNRILRIPLPFSPSPSPRSSGFSTPKLLTIAEPNFTRSENLYEYAARTQHRIESIERLAFATLAGSGIAGVICAFV